VRPRDLLGTLTLVTAVSALGCSWGENGLARLEQLNPLPDGGAFGAGEAGSSCGLPDLRDGGDAGAPTPPSQACLGLLSGQWAVRLVEFENISPLGPPPWNLTITDLFLAGLSPDKTSLELTFCGEENALTSAAGTPETIGENTIPPATVNAIARNPLAIPLPGDGTLQANGVTWLWGLRDFANPATAALPTTADASTVWDEDQDGHPGVTVDVVLPKGEIYLIKRAVFDLERGALAEGWITGVMRATIDQNVLGATSPVLDKDLPITAEASCASVYQVRCVDPGFDCSTLVQDYRTLFVGAPKP
jgi:hypothetical protein